VAGKLKTPAAALLLVTLTGAAGCSVAASRDEAPPHVVRAEDGGYEEVLSHEDDFGRRGDAEETAGGVAVVIGYVASAIGAALLPFLLL
jgi:hypothetical protein